MNKKANILFLSLLFFLSFELYAGTLPPAIKNACHAIWSVEDEFNQGTGFFTSPNRLITNLHVIEEALMENQFESIYLKQEQNSKKIKIKGIVGLSISPDLALLETETETDSYLSLGTSPLDKEKKHFIAGYPDGELRIIETIGPIKENLDELSVSTTLPLNHGSSGSPLMDSNAQVIGVHYTGTKNVTYLSSQNALKKFIEENKNNSCRKPTKECLTDLTENFLKTAENESATSTELFMLAYIFNEGNLGIEKNPQKAFEVINRADQRGDFPTAKFYKATMFYYGQGVEKDYKKAYEIASELAEQGHIDALFNIARMHFYGEGVERDHKKALEIFSKLAEQGYTEALAYKNFILYEGKGIKKIMGNLWRFFQNWRNWESARL